MCATSPIKPNLLKTYKNHVTPPLPTKLFRAAAAPKTSQHCSHSVLKQEGGAGEKEMTEIQ